MVALALVSVLTAGSAGCAASDAERDDDPRVADSASQGAAGANATESCSHGGVTFVASVSFRTVDVCNECTCQPGAAISCVELGCPKPERCNVGGKDVRTSNRASARPARA